LGQQFCSIPIREVPEIHSELFQALASGVHQTGNPDPAPFGQIKQLLRVRRFFDNITINKLYLLLRKPRFRFAAGRSSGKAVKLKHLYPPPP
jgi:hypothetical protein